MICCQTACHICSVIGGSSVVTVSICYHTHTLGMEVKEIPEPRASQDDSPHLALHTAVLISDKADSCF